jgi:hypothetical protein
MAFQYIRKFDILLFLFGNYLYKYYVCGLKNTTMEQEKLKQELDECKRLWSKYSCDCLHFEILSLEKRIAELSA